MKKEKKKAKIYISQYMSDGYTVNLYVKWWFLYLPNIFMSGSMSTMKDDIEFWKEKYDCVIINKDK
jgi:hypothetical protein